MIIFQLQPLCAHLCILQGHIDGLKNTIDNSPESANVNLSKQHIDVTSDAYKVMLGGFEKTGLVSAPRLLKQIIKGLPNITIVRLHENLLQLQEMLINEIKEVFLVFIPREKSIWLKKEENDIDPQLIKSFRSSIDDFNEAVLCYVCGRYTASVFHSMRILEYGLKAIAKDINLKFYRQNWGKIIQKIKNEIDKEIKTLSNQPKDSARTERLKFLSKAAQEFTYFKDGWRNYVMHSEDKYDEQQALSIFNHVKAFMVHLSTRLVE